MFTRIRQQLGSRSLGALFTLCALLGAGMARSDGGVISPATYAISVDDTLSISVYAHPEMAADVTVLPDGTINYPVVGIVRAAGLTVPQLTLAIVNGLTTINRPRVTVYIKSSRPRKVSVLGAVKATGQYDWKPGWRVLDAIAACGGAAQEPGLTQVTLVADGGSKTMPLDFNRLMKGGVDDNPELQPGDVVLVQQKDPSIAQVQVVGEVIKPGLYTVSADGISVVSLLAIVGGPTAHAALSRAQIMHGGTTQTVDLGRLMQNIGSEQNDVRLYAGDVLSVPVNQAKIAVIGEVKAAGVYEIPDGSHISALSAIATAGGVTTEADRSQAAIIRKAPNDKIVQIPVDIDKVLKGDAAGETQLQNGDVFYVPTRKKSNGTSNALSGLGIASILTTLAHAF